MWCGMTIRGRQNHCCFENPERTIWALRPGRWKRWEIEPDRELVVAGALTSVCANVETSSTQEGS